MAANLNPKDVNGTTELLPWMFLADSGQGIVACKDSSLLGCWQMEGVDIEADSLLDAAATQLDGALRRIADAGGMVWMTMERQAVAGYLRGSFDNPVADFIDETWGKTFVDRPVYTNKVFLSVAMPTVGGATSLGEAVGDNMGNGDKLPKAVIKALRSRVRKGASFGFSSRAELESACRKFEAQIATVVDQALYEIRTKRLVGADLLGYLKSTVSVNRIAPVAPVNDEYLDAYLSDTFFDNRYQESLVLDGLSRQYVGVFSLKVAPPGSMLQCLNSLSALPVHLRVNTCWRAAKKAQADRFFSGARAYDEIRGLTPRKLIKAAMSQQSANGDDTPTTRVGAVAEEYRQMMRRREAAFGWLASSIVVFAESPALLEEQMDLVARHLEQSGLVFIRERDGSLSGFCVGIPGHVQEVVRWHFVEAANATDLAPLISLDSGVPYNPLFSGSHSVRQPPNAVLRTRYNTVQYFNYHVGETGHTLLIGPTRNGKTMFQMFLTAQFLKYPNAHVFILDKDLSCKGPTLMLDGEHIDLDPSHGGGLALNPVSVIATPSGRVWLVGWLDRLLSGRGAPLTDEQVEQVSRAIERIVDVPEARLSTLNVQLPPDLSARLTPWCEGGAYGMYFDHIDDRFTFGKITCTEVGSLVAAGMIDVVRAYCDYAFYRIDLSLQNRNPTEIGPTMIYFEEAGFLLESPIFASRARDYLMTLAKKRAFLVMTAQSPEPFVNQPDLGAAVRDNVATVVFLPNPKATSAGLAKLYKSAFGVTDEQLSLIASAKPKAEYCVSQLQTGMFRVCRAQFPPEIVACLRSDAESQALLSHYYDPSDPKWKDRYVEAVMRL